MKAELLTTKEVEDLIQLNRVTIYRLIREANFPAVKVGGQWRFPREAVEAWLVEQGRVPEPASVGEATTEDSETQTPRQPTLTDLFATPEIISVLEAFSKAVGLSVLVTDKCGQTLVDHPGCRHPFCQLVRNAREGQTACLGARVAIENADTSHRLIGCAAGLCYLRTPIELDNQAIAFVFMGPLLTSASNRDAVQDNLTAFSHEIGVAPAVMLAQAKSVASFTDEQISILVDLLSQIISAILRIVRERLSVTRRLKEIASIVSDVK